MKSLGRILCSVAILAAGAGPALALDYEAKPIHWLILAPFRTAGAVSGATVSGLFSGPVDKGFHNTMRSEKKLAVNSATKTALCSLWLLHPFPFLPVPRWAEPRALCTGYPTDGKQAGTNPSAVGRT